MPTFDVDFEVYCPCGEKLSSQTTEGRDKSGLYIEVEPCEECLSESYKKGWKEREG